MCMSIADWLIWIFFGLPGLAIWKNWGVANAVCVACLTVLLPWIEHWYGEFLRHCSHD